ncbi:MAG: HDOD domain-containing protein [Gammaproteobacteria bacterium]|nr:MAG: HDOD domain-containing protein [Gammaproteobacteria bacterium]
MRTDSPLPLHAAPPGGRDQSLSAGTGSAMKPQSSPQLTRATLEKEIQQLPSLSVIVTEVLALIDRGDVELAVLMQKIGQDQALAMRVLRVVNSPFYGFSRHIGSLKDAGMMLGVHTLRNIVMAAGIMGHFPSREDQSFDRLSFWQHAIGTGVAAKVLASHCGLDEDSAFTAGLLHDIGKLVMAVYFPLDFDQVLAWRDKQDCLLKEAEQKVLGFDHTLVGARVTQKWKLPVAIIEAIQHHHCPDSAADIPFASLVHIADILCRGLEIGHGGDTLIPVLDVAAMQRLGLGWEQLRASLPEIEALNASANLMAEG